MPKAKKKISGTKKVSTKVTKKSEKKIKEENLIGIGLDEPVIDLTRETNTKYTGNKSKTVRIKSSNKATQKKENKVRPCLDNDQINNSSDNDSWFELFGYEEDEEDTAKEKASTVVPKKKDDQLKGKVITKKQKFRELEDNTKDPLDSDASDDSFLKYFPKEEKEEEAKHTKVNRKRAHKHRIDYSMIKDIEGFEIKSEILCSICKSHFNMMPGHPQNHEDHIFKVHAKAIGDNQYLCNDCDMTAPKTLKNFKVHHYRHRDLAKPKICTACGESFTNYNKWRYHKKSCNKLGYTCEKCGKVCTTIHNLENHIMIVHEKKGRTCRWCPKIVPLDEWETHKEMEKARKGIRAKSSCDICGTTFNSVDSAANHRRNFHRNIIVECHLCHKTFKSSQALSQHKTNNHLPKRFQCGYCEFRNASRYEVKRHACKVHKISKEELPHDAIIEHKVSEIPEMRESHNKKLKTDVQNCDSDLNSCTD